VERRAALSPRSTRASLGRASGEAPGSEFLPWHAGAGDWSGAAFCSFWRRDRGREYAAGQRRRLTMAGDANAARPDSAVAATRISHGLSERRMAAQGPRQVGPGRSSSAPPALPSPLSLPHPHHPITYSNHWKVFCSYIAYAVDCEGNSCPDRPRKPRKDDRSCSNSRYRRRH
jgi:hypothetical protein